MFGHPHPHTHPPLRDSHQIVINIHDTLLTWLDGDGQDDGRLGHRHKHYGCPLSGWAACFDGQEEGIRPSHDDDDDDDDGDGTATGSGGANNQNRTQISLSMRRTCAWGPGNEGDSGIKS